MDKRAKRELLRGIERLAAEDEELAQAMGVHRSAGRQWTTVMPLDDRAAYLRNLDELLEDAEAGIAKVMRASDALAEEFGPQLRLEGSDDRERKLGVALTKAGVDLRIAEGKVTRSLRAVADVVIDFADHHGIS